MKKTDGLFLRKQIEQYVPLNNQVWVDFASYWKEIVFKKGNYILKEGTVERYFYFVVDGVQRAYAIKPNGEEVSVGFTYKGEFTGGFDSFMSGKPAIFSLQALEDSHLVRIHVDDLNLMFDKYHAVERWGRLFNARILIGMAVRQVETRSFSAEERFERLIQDSPHILQLVPQKYLASYLGMTAETFSRMRARYRELS